MKARARRCWTRTAQARELGVEGVPFFVFNRRLAVSGAQEPEVLLRAIERAVPARSRAVEA